MRCRQLAAVDGNRDSQRAAIVALLIVVRAENQVTVAIGSNRRFRADVVPNGIADLADEGAMRGDGREVIRLVLAAWEAIGTT